MTKGWITRCTWYDSNNNIVVDKKYEIGEMSYSSVELTPIAIKSRGGSGNIKEYYKGKFKYSLNNDIYNIGGNK